MKLLVCPTLAELKQAFAVVGRDPLADAAEEHLLGCDACIAVIRELSEREELSNVSAPLSRRSESLETAKNEVLDRLVETLLAMRSSSAVESAEEEILHQAFLAPPERPEELGRIARYRVLRLLGAGGMGIVYEAEDLDLGRRVALKIMKPRLSADAVGRQRFLREARLAAAIEHDHIVTIHQVGEADGVLYLSMQLLQGISLKAHLKRTGALSVPEILQVGRQIALGLSAAHAKGLIHRDIKPGNIWLEKKRDEAETKPVKAEESESSAVFRVKILDFGLARAEAGERLTGSGMIVGTPGFMAPEQMDGKAVDARCDLFSLGCVLYCASVGCKPFKGKGVLEIMHSMATVPIEPIVLRPDLPRSLSALIQKLLELDPSNRPQSAREVCDVLATLERRTGAVPRSKTKFRVWLLVGFGLLGLLVWQVATYLRQQ